MTLRMGFVHIKLMINYTEYNKIAKIICNSLELDSSSTMFIYGSSTVKNEILNKSKLVQTRIFNKSGDLVEVIFEKANVYPDLDLRIITKIDPELLGGAVKQILNDIDTEILIELKIDSYHYPLVDIQDRSITSLFRRVFSIGGVDCLHNKIFLNELISLSNKNLTNEDKQYDKERIMFYKLAMNKLKISSKYKFNSEVLNNYTTYFSPRILYNEKTLRKVSLFYTNHPEISVWREQII